jgi:hypothetical protein
MTDWIAKLDDLSEAERRLIMKIAKGWLDKGENPTIVLSHVKKWISKNSDDGAGDEGTKPPEDQRDPAEQLEELVSAYAAQRGIKRSMAYGHVLRARPDLNAALGRERDAKLRKAARAFGDGYGVR